MKFLLQKLEEALVVVLKVPSELTELTSEVKSLLKKSINKVMRWTESLTIPSPSNIEECTD